jgi:biopolymer transport protein ExbD
MSKRKAPEVNAGSMADIAFLLLIFFLVTTTIDKDKGIARYLPLTEKEPVDIKEKNILTIYINTEGDFFVNEKVTPIEEISQIAADFIDNGGAIRDGKILYCEYCKGARSTSSSDNPQKAVIAISAHRKSIYKNYILLQNELARAYNQLRNRESQRLFKYDYTTVKKEMQEGRFKGNLEKVKAQLNEIKDLYPLLITDAEAKRQE